MPNSLLEKYRRGLAAQGVTDDRDDFFVMRDTLGVWAQEDPALLAAYPDFEVEWRAVREADSPGTLGGIKNTGKKAFLQSRQGMQAIGGLDKTDTEDVSQLETRIREIPSSVPWEDWGRAEGKEAVKVFLRDPFEITANIITAGLTGSVPALAGGLAGGLGGAAAGSALGPAGSALAGTAGAVAGTFTGSLAVEYGSKYLDVLREEGADLADPESIQRVLEDPETRARARSLAYRRGVPVAAFDAASAGLAGKFFKGLKGATTGQIVRRGGAEALVQGGLGGGGEIAGALSAGEQIKPGSVFEEIIGEMGPAAVEIGGAAARRSIAGGAVPPVAPPPADGGILPVPPITPLSAGPVAPIAPVPPVAPPARTNAQVAIAVERLTDEEAVARLAELQTKGALAPGEDLEIELLLARVPDAKPVVAPPVVAPIVTPLAAVGTPVEAPAPGIADVLTPAAAVVPQTAPQMSPAPSVVVQPEVQSAPVPPVAAQPPIRDPSSTYVWTVQQPPEGAPRMVQLDRFVNGEGAESFDLGQLAASGLPFQPPPAWIEPGNYTPEQLDAAIAKGPPAPVVPPIAGAVPELAPEAIPGTKAVAQRTVNAENRFIEFAQGAAGLTHEEAETALAEYKKSKAIKIDRVGGGYQFTDGRFAEADVLRRAAGITEKPPATVPPKAAAPVVAAQPDLPKPTEIVPMVPSAAPTPEERAAVAAVVVPQPQPLPYGKLVPGGVVENFRGFKPTKPLAWEAGVVNLMKPAKGSPIAQVELGDKGGAKGVTKVGMALLAPDGVSVVFAGIVTPQSILRVAGGNDKMLMPALQRMGVGTKGKRVIEVGGDMPVLLREVAEAGYKPLGIYRFAGEPAVIFQQFENLAAFDAAVGATPRVESAPGAVGPAVVNVADADLPVARITGLQRIEAEIDRISPLLMQAVEKKDAAAEKTLLDRYTELERRQKAAIAVNQTAARNQQLNPDSPEVQQAIRDLNNEPGDVQLQTKRNEEAFYSRLLRAVEVSQQAKASGAQWKATIRNSKLGVNQDEWALTRVDDLENDKVYTKPEVLDYLRANEVVVKDVTLGGGNPDAVALWPAARDEFTANKELERFTKVKSKTDSGIEPEQAIFEEFSGVSPKAWTEVLETLRASYGLNLKTPAMNAWLTARAVKMPPTHFSPYQLPGAKEGSYREVLLTVPDSGSDAVPNNARVDELANRDQTPAERAEYQRWVSAENRRWRDGHSQYGDVVNPIVRLRYNERTTADGKRMLFLEEVQAPQKGEFEKMPALFQKNWREIAFKWALRKAADEGFDSVGWTTGEQQVARYSLEKQVQSIEWSGADRNPNIPPNIGKHTHVIVDTPSGLTRFNINSSGIVVEEGANARGFEGKSLADVLGKEAASRILGTPKGKLEGEGLKIGGEGLKRLYDSDFRNVVNNLPVVKKSGQKVGTAGIFFGARRAFAGDMTLDQVRAKWKQIRDAWDGPTRSPQGWAHWNVTLDRAVREVVTAMEDGASYADAMKLHAWQEVADKLGNGTFEEVPHGESVHSLTITAAMREAVLAPQPRFQSASTPQAPRTDPSRIAVEATRAPQTETPAFKAWFGKSRAVDAQGKPRVLYHGTRNDITSFDASRQDTHALYGPGFYLTASRDVSGGDGSYAFKGSYTEDSVVDELRAPSVEEARKQFFADPQNSEYVGEDAEEVSFIPGSDGIVTVIESAGMDGTPNVMPLYAKIETPFLVNDVPSDWRPIFDRLIDAAVSIGIDRASFDNSVEYLDNVSWNPGMGDLFRGLRFAQDERGKNLGKEKAVRILKAAGYDGIMHTGGLSSKYGSGRPHDVVIVFNPSQVKSATGNSGAFNPANSDIRFQSARSPQPPRTDPSRVAVEATRAQQFGQVMSRLRAQGAKVDVLTTEFFRLGVRREIETQIAQLQQRAAGAVGPQKRAIERDIAHRQARLAEVDEARGATFGPWQIALAVDDIQNASMGNLITLIHEAVESLSLTMDSETKGKIGLAIQASITELRAARDAASERTGVEVASEQGGPFDLLAETLAQKLAAEGIVDPSIAQAVWRWIKDLYYRAAMAIQAAFGADPSHEMALDWFENQLERVIGGDYDYRIGNLIARFLPEQTGERISRFERPAGTPGAMTDFFDPYEQTLRQPGVLPNTDEGIAWNVQFQTGPAQRVGGLAIPNPEARARENAASNRRLIEELDAIRAAHGVTTPWEEWWGQFATSGSDPRVMLAELEQRDPSLATAAIGGERMTDVMNGEAALGYRRLIENLQASAIRREASATENITAEADSVIEASREVNRLEKDRRNSDLQEGALQKRLKDLVRQFVRDNSAGYRASEQQGALAEAVREAENLIAGDPIPERIQQVFKAVLDGKTPVFDYIRAIAGLELDLASMTQAEVVKAIRDSADSSPALGRLAENRPLLTALAVLARKNQGLVDEINMAYLTNAEDYHKIHDELQLIREATDEQLKQMLATMDERVKSVGPRERLKKDYLKRRRALRDARDRLSRAQVRVDTITQVLPDVAEAVERAQQQGSEAPSEWSPVEGAVFTEMVPTEAGWTRRTRELHFKADGSAVDSDAIQAAIARNLQWLKEKISKKGSKTWEEVNRQTMQMRATDASAQYATAQGRKMDRFLAPMMSEARNLGGLGPKVAQALAFFEHIRFSNRQQVETNAHEWSRAWKDVQRTTGIKDNGLLQKQIYDPVSYFLNTEPGLDEEAAIRQALRMARARLAVPPSNAFNVSVERLLRASKAGFEHLVRIATENGAFVRDPTLKSELRNAVARGWLTSMRSIDGGLVQRLTRDMEKSGWKLAREWVDDPRGGGRPKRLKKVRAVTFRDFEAEDMANSDALVGVLNRLFSAGILRDWLMPFINKGGVEVFRRGKTEIPQSVIQDAWAQAGQGTTNAGERILRWIDLVDAATTSEEFAGETQAVGDEDGDVLDEGDGMPGEENTGRFRLNMLRQIDALFGMESKMAFDASQTRDMFDPFGPKPHVVMDARMNDHIPQEHINFAKLDVQSSGMLLAEIAFHSAFGRNGARMVSLLAEMRKKADAAKVDYEGLQQTTDAGRAAEAIALGWRDPKELERLAGVADDIQRFQDKLEGFMGVGHAGGPFDSTSRVWMTLLNFLSGQIVDNPKTAFYNILNLGQTPFAQRSLGPETIRTVSDAFLTTARTGMGSLLEAMHLHLMHSSAEELELSQATGQVRNLPWSVAMADIGPQGRQGWKEQVFIKPMQAIRFAQNKGVGLPLQGQAREFPRLAVIPGLGVSNFVSQVAGRSGMMAQTRQLERLLARGAKYFATHRGDATNPAFRFKARDLGMGRWDQGVFDWWRVKSVEYGLGTLEDLVRSAMPPMARGERVITKDQLLKTAGAVATEVNGDSSVNTMPGLLVSHPFLRSFFPLLRWPFWAMHKTNEGLATQAGRRNWKSYARGVGILAMWNLPIGLAFTFLLDEYDEEVTGKKSNLPPLGSLAALPFLGPAAELLAADRSVPDTLVAYAVRGARGGNLGGIAADFVGQIANPSDPSSGRRVISLDQRVLVMSQLLNLQQAASNVVHQGWTTTWASFWAPLFRSVGGNGALHALDIANNVAGLDNAESRQVTRVNAGNWLRSAAGELDIELRPGGSGTPTPMSVWTREMLTAAMANDRIGFTESYRKALEAARKNVSSDPSVPAMDREREAERRVLGGWRGRNPLGIFARPPTEIEVRRMLGIMSEEGAQDVRDALNRYNQFTRLIAPSPEQSQARAAERRLMRPPAPPNPFRRQLAPTY